MTIGGGQFVSDAIDLCGGRNIFAGSTVMAPVVNIESVIAADPMAIITARPDTGDRSWQAYWRRFPGLFAVEADNLYTVPVNEMHRHGPRAIAATRLLCERIEAGARQGCQPGGEEHAAPRGVVAAHQPIVLVERVLQPRAEIEVLAELVARHQVEHRVRRLEHRDRRVGDALVAPLAAVAPVAAQAQRAEAA